jgi:hypothetical protein
MRNLPNEVAAMIEAQHGKVELIFEDADEEWLILAESTMLIHKPIARLFGTFTVDSLKVTGRWGISRKDSKDGR